MRYIAIFLMHAFFMSIGYANVLTFGVVPQQSSMEMIKKWQPVINYLEKSTGEKIALKVEHSIPEFEKVLYNGGYDIAYMNPYHYVIAHKREGYDALVRDEKNVVGIVVVRKEDGIRDISMLKGKEFLFPAPDAFAATLLVKYELLKKYNIDIQKDKQYRYVNSHESVYKGIARKIGDAGGGIERTFNDLQDQKSKDSLLIIYRTKSYPSHPFAFHRSLSKNLKKKMANALLQMPQELVVSLSMKRLQTTDDGEYDSVRDLAQYISSIEE